MLEALALATQGSCDLTPYGCSSVNSHAARDLGHPLQRVGHVRSVGLTYDNATGSGHLHPMGTNVPFSISSLYGTIRVDPPLLSDSCRLTNTAAPMDTSLNSSSACPTSLRQAVPTAGTKPSGFFPRARVFYSRERASTSPTIDPKATKKLRGRNKERGVLRRVGRVARVTRGIRQGRLTAPNRLRNLPSPRAGADPLPRRRRTEGSHVSGDRPVPS